jgi:hypothetical protein
MDVPNLIIEFCRMQELYPDLEFEGFIELWKTADEIARESVQEDED